MMTDAATAGAWLHCYDANASFPLHNIAAALKQAGVAAEIIASRGQADATCEMCESQILTRPAIVFFSTVTRSLCDFVRTCSQHGLRRLLAVAMRDAVADDTA